MSYSGFFNTVDNGFSFPGSQDEWLGDFPGLEPTFVASPVQLSETLPDLAPSFSSPHPASSIYPPALDEHHSANFVAMSPTPNAHTPLDALDWHLPTYPHSAQNYGLFSNPQYSGTTSTIMPNTHQPPMTHNAGRPSMHNGLQGYGYAVANGSPPVHDTFYSPQNHVFPSGNTVPSQYNSSPVFFDQTQSYHSAMGTRYKETQPQLAGVIPSSYSIPSDSAFHPMVPHSPLEEMPRRKARVDHSITHSPYHPIRTSSLPAQAVSPKETVLHTCRWIRDDGTICTAQITWARVPEHLTTHGVKNMSHDHRVPCRWSGCRIRGDKNGMNRESIVRHVREKHLGYRRTL